MNDELSKEDMDKAFVSLCYEAIKNLFSYSALPLFLFLLYSVIRVAFKGNIQLTIFSHYNLIFLNLGGLVIVFLRAYVTTHKLYDFKDKRIILTGKRSLMAILDGLCIFFTYAVLLFYGYMIIYMGFKSFFSFRTDNWIYPVIRIFIFIIVGLIGAWRLYQLRQLSKLLSVEDYSTSLQYDESRHLIQAGIAEYIFKSKIVKLDD